MLREQPSLSAWGRPAGWVPRPHVRRRARLADTVERLVRPHDPCRGLRTRSDHHLSQLSQPIEMWVRLSALARPDYDLVWLRKGFDFVGAWTVCEQNRLLA